MICDYCRKLIKPNDETVEDEDVIMHIECSDYLANKAMDEEIDRAREVEYELERN